MMKKYRDAVACTSGGAFIHTGTLAAEASVRAVNPRPAASAASAACMAAREALS